MIPAVRTISETAEFATLRPEWDALVGAMDRPSPFLLHGWLLEWWRHRGRGRLTVHVAREGDRLTGALPMFVERRLGLNVARFLGRDAAALADVLVADGADPSTPARLVDLAAESGADFADLFGLPEQSRLAAAAGGERLALIPRAEAPVLDLEAGWEAAYRAKTSSKRRSLQDSQGDALERGYGLLLEVLLEAGCTVCAPNPKPVERYRSTIGPYFLSRPSAGPQSARRQRR